MKQSITLTPQQIKALELIERTNGREKAQETAYLMIEIAKAENKTKEAIIQNFLNELEIKINKNLDGLEDRINKLIWERSNDGE